MIWALVPAAGSGTRCGDGLPKQYRTLAGAPMLRQTLLRLFAQTSIGGAVVALAADDAHWSRMAGTFPKPVLTCIGGAARAASVLAALRALPTDVAADDLVLVHDAARPCVQVDDIARLLVAAQANRAGALLAAPLRDTLKRAAADGRVAASVPREHLWRALTPQAFARGLLIDALEHARRDGVSVTDEAMAIERIGLHPTLVEGREDNIKVTVAEDLALAEHILAIQQAEAAP
ncbi:MAG: 2-C-methyl-D-erythritol 4-phosphate cytidylyltransferase [Proteobacteria bacterium]|nr:2-C-methyl-D-erythritol 4-phosphate cytidylyltransferase [Pseudomonadota bacterium]